MDFKNLKADVNLIQPYHFTPGRGGAKIRFVVLHHNAGDLSNRDIHNVWLQRQASAHYQVASSGTISQHVWDDNTAWATGHPVGNQQGISIEHANRGNSMTDAVIENGARLTAALCKYYGLGEPQWGVNVFPHSHFSATACPGALQGALKERYMARARAWYHGGGASATVDSSTEAKPQRIVTVNTPVLNVRAEPTTSSRITTQVHQGQRYTIVGTQGEWGKLKSGAGWIHLGYVKG